MTDAPISSLTLAGIKAQREAATPTRSVWVSASAGSGKTRVLVDRTLRLMLQGTEPQRILCITFTKAAAAEMANRLNETLGEWSVSNEEALKEKLVELQGRAPTPLEITRARQLFAKVLDAPGGIKIQTIHAFCGSVLGRFPIEAGISPNFQELDDRTASEIMEVCRDRMLVQTRNDSRSPLAEAMKLSSRQVNEQDFTQLMQGLSSKRGRIKRFTKAHGGLKGSLTHLAELLEIDSSTTEEALLERAVAVDNFDFENLRQAAETLLSGGKTDVKNGEKLASWLSDPDKRVAGFEAYCSVFFTLKGDQKADRSLASQASQKKMPDLLDILHQEAERLAFVLEERRKIRVLATTSALLTLGDWLLQEYEKEKTRRGSLDFDDLILITRDLLKKKDIIPWVMFKLDGGIDHILVDEAQDTSPEQWEVIEALTEEFFTGDPTREMDRTIFVVGDEKQSIYSFQGADPKAFDHMRRLFERKAEQIDKAWQKVPMELSFRSTHAVLSLVDDVFAAEAARKGVTEGDEQVRHFIHRINQAGFTEIWPVVKPEPQDESDPWEIPLESEVNFNPAAKLAQNIAIQIKQWLQSEEILEAQGRPIEPGDIMILVQSRNSLFEELVRTLKQHDIPVAGADRMTLGDQLAVQDLLALGKFVLLPDDDLNLATILKSPFVGCDDMELYSVAYKRRGTLWSSLQDNADKNPKFGSAVQFLKTLLSKADFIPVYEFFAEILGSMDGRRKLLSRLGEEALDPIEEFLSLALTYQRGEATSLQGFMHWFQAGGAEIKRDMEQGRNEVRILTVHGSKGLQAPIVILPDTCQRSQAPRVSNIIWSEEEVAVPLWPVRSENYDSYTKSAQQKIKDRLEAEKRRLLYVALTRAEDRLYICGWENKQKRPSGCWYDLIDAVFVAEDGPEIEEIELPFGDVARRRSSGGPKQLEVKPTSVAKEKVAVLPAWVTSPPPAEPFPPNPLTPSREEEEPSVRSPLGPDDGYRFHRGLIIHRLLESLPSILVERRRESARKWLSSPAHGLSAEQQKTILEETLSVLDHPEFGEIFGPESRAEVPLTGLLENQIMSGQIDRLLVKEVEVLIIDYKTNRPSPREVENVPGAYLRQMQIYRTALEKMYPEKVIKCALLWTDGPHLMVLPTT